MEIKINVDETMFKDVLENELKAFSKEELKEIIKTCMVEYLNNSDVLKDLFIVRNVSRFGYDRDEPTEILKQAASKIDISEDCKDIVDSMIKNVKENHTKILENLLLNLLINGITDDYNFKCTLERSVHEIINQVEYERNNK